MQPLNKAGSMKKRSRMVPYLQVVHGNTPPDFTPPCPPGLSPSDWLAFLHFEEIQDGLYDYWVRHNGLFLPDATLKAQGLIPANWDMSSDDAFNRQHDAPLVPTIDSTP